MSSFIQHTVRWLTDLARNRYWWGGLAALLLLSGVGYLVFDNYLMPTYTRHEASVTLPTVEGRSLEEARETLATQGLRVEQQPSRYNPNVPRNQVVDQTPDAGRNVKPGRRVYLKVNSGKARKVAVPDVLTESQRVGSSRLRNMGLRVDSILADTIPAEAVGTITRQEPAPGDTVTEGAGVRLWIAQGIGEERVRVPNVYGFSVERAREQLLRARLRLVVLDTTRSNAPDTNDDVAGHRAETTPQFVIRQDPRPGDRLREGRDVRLFTTTDSLAARRARAMLPDSLTTRDGMN